jgi:hypothetical protein
MVILEKGMVMVGYGKAVERKVWYKKLYKKSKYDLF